MPRIYLIELRRGTAASWAAANPTLMQGEPGFETDTRRTKIGDGVTAWNALAYLPEYIETYIAAAVVGSLRVLVTDAAGQVVHAENTDATHASQAMKISLQSGGIGDSLNAQIYGRITDPGWAWTPKASLYVGANGLMTETPPMTPAVFSRVVAIAETATRILMLNESPVMLV